MLKISYLSKPEALDIIEALFFSNIINNNDCMCSFIICASNGSKSLLPSGIPDLQFYNISLYSDRSLIVDKILESEINTNSGKIALLEGVISKSSK